MSPHKHQKKRILLISYYFPPCGGAAVQRWLRLLPYLVDKGWLFTVITTSNGDYPVYDESLCAKVPEQVKVIRTKTPTIGKLFKRITGLKSGIPQGNLLISKDASLLTRLSYWIRINLIIPDMRVFWNRFAIAAAGKELRTNKYELLITTGPPHSTHLAGWRLKRKTSLKWIADFRDPWTKISYLQTIKQNRFIKAINSRLEKSVLNSADLSLIISRSIADSLPAGNKYILYNGYDPQDFNDISKKEHRAKQELRIKYLGEVRKEYSLSKVLDWLNEIATQKVINRISVSLIGGIRDDDLQLTDYPDLNITNLPHITHKDALREMVNSDVLLLTIPNCPDNKGILTTKLFEYLATDSFIIGIGPTDGEAAAVLSETGAGVMIDYDDKESFMGLLKDLSQKVFNGEILRPSTQKVTKYSAPEQAKALIEQFENIVGVGND